MEKRFLSWVPVGTMFCGGWGTQLNIIQDPEENTTGSMAT